MTRCIRYFDKISEEYVGMLSKFFKDNILPNPIIEAWYNASEKTESINDYAANQIEHYYKTGEIE